MGPPWARATYADWKAVKLKGIRARFSRARSLAFEAPPAVPRWHPYSLCHANSLHRLIKTAGRAPHIHRLNRQSFNHAANEAITAIAQPTLNCKLGCRAAARRSGKRSHGQARCEILCHRQSRLVEHNSGLACASGRQPLTGHSTCGCLQGFRQLQATWSHQEHRKCDRGIHATHIPWLEMRSWW